MKNSFIRKVTLLLSGVLITSLLFFVAMSMTYKVFYEQNILATADNISSNWTGDIDRRLNSIYEHVYDLSATIYKKCEVRSGSDQMDFTDLKEIQDEMNYKMMASDDITVLFVIDTESDLYLYYSSNTLSYTMNSALKLFVQQYGRDNYSSISNRIWDLVDVLENGYYYKAVSLGKYVIGAMSDCKTYRLRDGFVSLEGDTCLIMKGNEVFLCQGDASLREHIVSEKKESYISKGYVFSFNDQKYADTKTVFIRDSQGIQIPWKIVSIFLIFDSALCVLLVALSIMTINKRVRNPIRDLVNANADLSKGLFDTKLDVKEAGSSEFEELYRSFNDMSGKIENLTIASYDAEIRRQQNQLKMLRAQMRPHTFLNGITTISNMTYTSTPEQMRKYIQAFASFTRYMLHNAGDWTTVEEELKHINNYVEMQKIRFPKSIEITFDYPNEVAIEKIPYLTLFSLVENSFKHAMTLEDTMYVSIRGEFYEEEGFKGVRLIEEDNGPGFTKESLDKLEKIDKDDLYTKEHLGLTNIRYSMNLIYHRDDLLRLSNREEGGARIELLIPQEEDEDETSDM